MNVLEEPSGAGCSNRGYGIFSEYGAKSMALPALRAGGYSGGAGGEKETDKHALSKYCQEEPKRTTVCRCSFCVISFDPQSSPMGIHPVYDEETETQRREEMCPGFHS